MDKTFALLGDKSTIDADCRQTIFPCYLKRRPLALYPWPGNLNSNINAKIGEGLDSKIGQKLGTLSGPNAEIKKWRNSTLIAAIWKVLNTNLIQKSEGQVWYLDSWEDKKDGAWWDGLVGKGTRCQALWSEFDPRDPCCAKSCPLTSIHILWQIHSSHL